MQFVLIALMTITAIEFGVHIIYHAVTGKAGLYDPPFEYLKDIWKGVKKRCLNGNLQKQSATRR